MSEDYTSTEQVEEAQPETEVPPDKPPIAPPAETISIPNEASRDTSLVHFSIGPGDTVRVEEEGYISIFTKENFKKVADWFSAYT